MSELYVNIGGVWKPVSSVSVNIGGAWKKASGVYQNVGGTWKSALISPEASGGTVTTDGDYKIHTFTSSGSFVVSTPGTLSDVLIVAGGGSGGWGTDHPAGTYDHWGGGGGAGGKIHLTNLAVTPQTYTITIGNGGAVSADKHFPGNNGGNSSAFGNTAIGGGGGGTVYPYGHIETPRDGYGKDGGSGGGGGVHLDASHVPIYSGTGGSGTSGQGYAGSDSRIVVDNTGYNMDEVVGGGGGGAGGAGSYSSTLKCGTGGAGYTFLGVEYAKGGDAKYNTPKTTAGSGGYGGTQYDSPQAGYKGIVIIRYKYK